MSPITKKKLLLTSVHVLKNNTHLTAAELQDLYESTEQDCLLEDNPEETAEVFVNLLINLHTYINEK